MSKMNWDKIAFEERIKRSKSESVFDWSEEKREGRREEKRGRRKLPDGFIRCSLCIAILKPQNLSRHDKRVHKIQDRQQLIQDRQQLVEKGILPTTKYKLKHVAWHPPDGSSFGNRFTVDIVTDDPTWERQKSAAFSIDRIAPRIMLCHKAESLLRRSIRCTLVCYSNDSEARTIAIKIVEELASFVVLTVKIEAKKSSNRGDLAIYL